MYYKVLRSDFNAIFIRIGICVSVIFNIHIKIICDAQLLVI